MIRYEGFRKTYGRVLAVEGLDLEVRPGEMLALIGPNGSGKSTTLKSAVGLVRPSAGRVLVDGVDVALGPAARARLGYLPQRISFPEGVAARDAMRLYARLRGADLGTWTACSSGWAWPMPRAGRRTASPEGCASASASPWHCSGDQKCCCSTSPAPRSIRPAHCSSAT